MIFNCLRILTRAFVYISYFDAARWRADSEITQKSTSPVSMLYFSMVRPVLVYGWQTPRRPLPGVSSQLVLLSDNTRHRTGARSTPDECGHATCARCCCLRHLQCCVTVQRWHQGDNEEPVWSDADAIRCPLVGICRESRPTSPLAGEASDIGRLKGDKASPLRCSHTGSSSNINSLCCRGVFGHWWTTEWHSKKIRITQLAMFYSLQRFNHHRRPSSWTEWSLLARWRGEQWTFRSWRRPPMVVETLKWVEHC